MSKISVECPQRKNFGCGAPCGFEQRATLLQKAISDRDPGPAIDRAATRTRQFTADKGCPKLVINPVIRSIRG